MLSIEDLVALSCSVGLPKARTKALLLAADDVCLELALECAEPGRARPRLSDVRAAGEQALRSARAAGIHAVGFGDALYPPLLAAIPDPPLVLWVKGCPQILTQPAVAIVGSRAASPYGIEAASRLASELAAAGAVVVSGLARGVDSAAHRGALDAGGETVAVLGSGADVIYPPEHDQLASAIVDGGALLSELVPGTPPRPFHFPARNRIISGLSLAVIVVEAAERSGSLITASCGLSQGREVMAVPGSILSGRHRGCHALIRDGAAVVESAEDVLAEIRNSPLIAATAPCVSTLGSEDHPVLGGMEPGESYDLDALSLQTGLLPAELLPALLELELRGAVRRVDGGRFVRANVGRISGRLSSQQKD